MVRERGRADGLPSLLADEVPFPVGDDPDAAARHVAYEIGAVVAGSSTLFLSAAAPTPYFSSVSVVT